MVLVGFALVLTTYIGLGVVDARSRQQTADSSRLEQDRPCSGL
jgi:hypothetical protein